MKALERLGETAKEAGIVLRQSYVRVAKKIANMVQRYGHAKQMKRAKLWMKKLSVYLGPLIRDVERKGEQVPDMLKRP